MLLCVAPKSGIATVDCPNAGVSNLGALNVNPLVLAGAGLLKVPPPNKLLLCSVLVLFPNVNKEGFCAASSGLVLLEKLNPDPCVTV